LGRPLLAFASPEVFGIGLLALLLLAAALFIYGSANPEWAGSHSGWDSWPRWVSDAIQWFGPLLGAWGTYRLNTDDKPAWWFPVASALFAGFAWKLLLSFFEHKGKKVGEKVVAQLQEAAAEVAGLNAELRGSQLEGYARTRLIMAFSDGVFEKIARIRAELARILHFVRTSYDPVSIRDLPRVL
jgi:hypothetical protein